MKEESAYPLIETGIPMPPKTLIERYKFAEMEVGNSFRVKSGTVNKVRSAACQFAKRNPPAKFTIRVVDPIKKTYRCWRVA